MKKLYIYILLVTLLAFFSFNLKDISGIYFMPMKEKDKSLFLKLDKVEGKIVGKMTGSLMSSERVVMYFIADLKDLEYKKKNISFKTGKLQLSNTPINILNPQINPEDEKVFRANLEKNKELLSLDLYPIELSGKIQSDKIELKDASHNQLFIFHKIKAE